MPTSPAARSTRSSLRSPNKSVTAGKSSPKGTKESADAGTPLSTASTGTRASSSDPDVEELPTVPEAAETEAEPMSVESKDAPSSSGGDAAEKSAAKTEEQSAEKSADAAAKPEASDPDVIVVNEDAVLEDTTVAVGDSDDSGADDDWAAEEQKLREENNKRAEAQKKKNKMSTKEKVELLENLLQKAAAYTAFLRQRMKESHGVVTTEDKDTGKKRKIEDGVDRHPGQPKLLTGGIMRRYQVEGVTWIASLYENGLNGILADEMGLGKTVQVIGFISHLVGMKVNGPFLIVVPLSTITNWQREFAKWAPEVDTLLYHGSKEDRKLIRDEWGFERKTKQVRKGFPVIITSFEVAMNDSKKLQNVSWKYLVVDEGHRLKNKDCKLLMELKALHTDNRLLLSGTPLQNNLSELWSLLNFILPEIFQDLSTFQTWFDFDDDLHSEAGTERMVEEEKKHKTISKLHTILDPFLLRRLKTDVLQHLLPVKREYLILAPLTETQLRYNTAIGNKSLGEMISGDAELDFVQDDLGAWSKTSAVNDKASSMQNVLMQMRKCCNHPYLFQAPLDPSGNIIIDERLVQAAGKLQLLDRMLTKLKETGHKVLIFCQMTKMLDILEDYLELRKWKTHRIDGMVHWKERQGLMDEYNNSPDSFVFLLSTRAGGLGINLVSADTVIIYDSDFNPQQDLQAQDRCHRIGQTKPVTVLRLVTVDSVETRILERATNKRKLELVAIARKRFKVADKLEHGADMEALQAIGTSKREEDKKSLVQSLTEVRQSLSGAELAELLRPKSLADVNKDIITDEDLDTLLTKREAGNAITEDGKGWQVVSLGSE
mmetsp:Transcript_38745/g.91462  ORF Transcript_38745/g.91462 Transcript_38745/m.91462 type:complete len:830 (+) Transcript_38745:103-2592(+)